MDKTIEEILLEQLEQPVILKNGSVADGKRGKREKGNCVGVVGA